jgi:hypothetical protein
MRGQRIPLSLARRLIGDLMHFAMRVPGIPVQRRMNVSAAIAARCKSVHQPPVVALFVKGFALVAEAVPELRRSYCQFPWPHLYECPASVASVAVEREHAGERVVFGVLVKDVARRPLAEIGRMIRLAVAAPLESSKDFRRALRVARLPRILRRLFWWFGLNLGRQRANYFGTFGVTSYGSLGAESLHPISPLTTTLTYGPIEPDGAVNVRLVYDHRVLDGATVARALAQLEIVMNTTILEELADAAPQQRTSTTSSP